MQKDIPMRILRGFIGCWLGLVVTLPLTILMPSPGNSNLLLNLAAVASLIAFVPTVIFGIFEKPASGPGWYVAVGTALAACALAAIMVASGASPQLGDVRQVADLIIALGCACFVGVTTGGAYRLFAGAKQG